MKEELSGQKRWSEGEREGAVWHKRKARGKERAREVVWHRRKAREREREPLARSPWPTSLTAHFSATQEGHEKCAAR